MEKIKGGNKMKKIIIGVMMSAIFLVLGACGANNDVKNAATYLPKVVKYAAKLTLFSNQVPLIAQQAVIDPNARIEFEEKLKEMKSEIQTVNALTPPSQLQELHTQLVAANKLLEAGIDQYLAAIKDGKLNQEFVDNLSITQPIDQITNVINQMQN